MEKIQKRWPWKNWHWSLIISLSVLIAVDGCLNDSKSSQTAAVRFSNPNSESILPETHSIEVHIVYPTGDTVLFYSGTALLGPWEGSIQKSDLDMILFQYDMDGVLLTNESYSYKFQNGTLKVVNKLELNPNSMELTAGGTPVQINAKLFPSDLNLEITWTSADSAVAQVTPEGIVDPLAAGRVYIYGTIGEGLKDSVLVTVLGVLDTSESLALLKPISDSSLAEGSSLSFKVLVNKTEGVIYSWKKDGNELAATSEFELSNLSPSDAGQYILEISWNGEMVSDSFTISVETPFSFTITLDAGENGTVLNGGTSVSSVSVTQGDQARFSFEPDEGYVISKVFVDGSENPEAAANGEFTFLDVNDNHSLQVTFEKARLDLEVSLNDSSKGAVEILPQKEHYSYGDTVNISATPQGGSYKFTGWSGDTVSEKSSLMLILLQNSSVTANFGDVGRYSVNISVRPGLNAGNVSIEPDSGNYLPGTQITLSAVPEVGYQFTGWEGSVSEVTGTDNPLVLTIADADIDVIGNYSLKQYTLTITQSNGGSIFLDGQLPDAITTVNYGDSTAVSFTPNTGFHLSDVLIDGVSNSTAVTTGSHSFLNISQSHSVSGTFSLNQYTVSFDLDGKGTRIGGGALSQSVAHGENAIAPSVQANVGWVFEGWDAGFTNVTQNLTVTAAYLPEMYNVTISAGTGGNVSPSGVRSVAHGTSLNISAMSVSGYIFQNWTSSGLSISDADAASTSVTNVTFDGTVTANFLKLWACGDSLVDDRPNLIKETYSTVANGSQCWMGENLRAGTYISAAINSQDPTDNTIEKYCWENDFSNCATDGGLYLWHELMANDSTPKSQGICPDGWHVPDSTEFQILINSAVDIGLGGNGQFVIDTKSFGSGDPWFWLSSQHGSTVAPDAVSLRDTGPQIEYWFSSLTAFYARCIKD